MHKKVKEGRWTKEGRYLIALAHEGTMASASPSLIGSTWASADGFRRSLQRSSSSFAASSLGLTFLSCTRGGRGWHKRPERYLTVPVAAHSVPRWMSFETLGVLIALPSWPKVSWKTRPLP